MAVNFFLYAVVVACAVVAVFGRGRGAAWARAAFGVTLAADAVLLFAPSEYYPAAIAFFASAHGCWVCRNDKAGVFEAQSLSLVILPAVVAIGDILWISVLVYAVCLLLHLWSAAYGFKKGRVGKAALFGAVLFVACDVCVALCNLFDWAANFWILAWVFYAPSLICLAASAYYKGNGELRMENGE